MIPGLIMFTWAPSHRPRREGLSMELLVRMVSCLGKCKETYRSTLTETGWTVTCDRAVSRCLGWRR